ncbi:Antigen P35 (plasmid) [Borrelia crocidurae DOU]|uniref:Antigen P35 n=1 Tax=Borrelia crocidurae DOU TaxID=1293575 RepID=W5SLA7_9SPIR|nr:complement regulator-acquiring protein [Borrelia crocidurae]AHH07463.1 Antigen P35 [Borrelia crocidurae DOU]
MRNNILSNIFSIFVLTALVFIACNQNGSADDVSADVNKESQGASGDSAKQSVLSKLFKKVADEAKVNKGQKEPDNTQYGLKDTVFKIIKDDKNKTYDEDTNEDTRHKFYGSLSWKEATIKGLGEVLAKLAGEATYKDTWPKNLVDVGAKVQGVIQVAFGDIETKKDNLNTLSLEKINELNGKVKELEEARTTWTTFVTDLIKDYKADTGSIKTTVKNLVDNYLTPKYNDSLSGLITSSEKLGEDIGKILEDVK